MSEDSEEKISVEVREGGEVEVSERGEARIDVIHALAKEAVAHISRKISSFKRIPEILGLAPLALATIITAYTLYRSLIYTGPPSLLAQVVYRIAIIALMALSSIAVVILIFVWDRHIYWSKMSYLAILDITVYMKKRDELFTRNVEEYVAYATVYPALTIFIIYILATIFWLIIGDYGFFSFIMLITSNTIMSILVYFLIEVLRRESRYEYGILSFVNKVLGGKRLRTYNPRLDLKIFITSILLTLGVAAYYWLYRAIDSFNKHCETNNETETALSLSLLRLV